MKYYDNIVEVVALELQVSWAPPLLRRGALYYPRAEDDILTCAEGLPRRICFMCVDRAMVSMIDPFSTRLLVPVVRACYQESFDM